MASTMNDTTIGNGKDFTGMELGEQHNNNEPNKDIDQVERFLEQCRMLVLEKSLVCEDELECRLPDINTWVDSVVENQRDMFRKLIKGYKNLNDKYQLCKSQITKIEKENSDLREERKAEEQSKRTREVEMDNLKNQNCQLDQDKKKLTRSYEKLLVDVKTKYKNIERLNELLSIKDQTLCVLENDVKAAKLESKKSRDAVAKLECQLNQLIKNMDLANKESNDKINAYNEVITTIQNELSRKGNAMSCMEGKLAEKEQQLQDMSKEVCHLNNIIESIKKAKEEDTKHIESYIKSIKLENEKMRQSLINNVIDNVKTVNIVNN